MGAPDASTAPDVEPGDVARSQELGRRLRDEVARSGGAIPFSRFMEVALYEPGLGYYEHAAIGRSGDFVTSVSAGPLFGELLARRACKAWETLGLVQRPGPLTCVEAGAHDGRLAADVLGWLHQHRPEMAGRVRYVLVEPSPTRRGWQAATLSAFAAQVAWADAVPAFDGVLLCNELLDAFPLERHAWDAARRRWWRLGVTVRDDRLVPCRMELDAAHEEFLSRIPEELRAVLPDSHVVEHAPGAEAWWSAAARALGRGCLMTFDYGFEEWDRFRPGRANGTLRGYRRHRLVDDVLALPGLVDLTAHVDFGRIQRAGEAAGLATTDLCSQHRLLSRWMAEALAAGEDMGPMTPARLRQWQALSHPSHLGHAFRALIQERP